jgi:hypothetical protein
MNALISSSESPQPDIAISRNGPLRSHVRIERVKGPVRRAFQKKAGSNLTEEEPAKKTNRSRPSSVDFRV